MQWLRDHLARANDYAASPEAAAAAEAREVVLMNWRRMTQPVKLFKA